MQAKEISQQYPLPRYPLENWQEKPSDSESATAGILLIISTKLSLSSTSPYKAK